MRNATGKKNKEKVRKRENNRRKHQRLVLKAVNPATTKALYRKEKKSEAKSKSLSQSPSSSFSQASAKARSLKKVASALPKSPGKTAETVQSLAKQFKLKIKYHDQHKAGRPANKLSNNKLDFDFRIF